MYMTPFSLSRTTGNMMPRKEEEVPQSVQLAQKLVTRLADYTEVGEDEDVYTNVKALANTIIAVGAYCLLLVFAPPCCIPDQRF
jgi:hypothetical protein